MKKILYIFILTTLLIFLQTFAFASGSNTKNDDTLVVGMELQFPPFETTDENGNPTGFSVDFATEMAEALGKKVEIKNIAWTGLIPAVESGAVDIIISSMSATEERKKKVDFTHPYGSWYLVTLLNKDVNVKKFKDLNDAQYTVAVKIGTVSETIANKELPNAKVQKFDSWDAVVLEIAQGKADAAFYDPISVYNAHKKYSDTTKTLFQPIETGSNPIAGAMKKGNDDLREEINAFIKQAKEDGTIARISKKYFSELNQAIADQGGPAFFE